MDLKRVAAERLQNQRIAGPRLRTPASVVAWFGGVQAQEYGPAKWALAHRLKPGATDAAIDRAINQGRILRTHVLRPTWHFVTPADIRWMLDLTAPYVHKRMATYDRHFGLDTSVMTRATSVIERALGDGAYLTRAELGDHLSRAGIEARSQRLAHIAMYAELEGVICSGPRRGKEITYALVANRAPGAKPIPRDEALAELTRRFFRSHGPATVRDFVWWSGLRTADAKRGLEIIRARPRDIDGSAYWTIGRPVRAGASRDTVHLLPIYDEYLVAYKDREVVPHAGYPIDNFWHALVISGQVAGTWRTTSRPKSPASQKWSSARATEGVRIDVTTLRLLTTLERRGVEKSAAGYGRFLKAPVSVKYLPRQSRR